MTYTEQGNRKGTPVRVGDWTRRGEVVAVLETHVLVKFDGITREVTAEDIDAKEDSE